MREGQQRPPEADKAEGRMCPVRRRLVPARVERHAGSVQSGNSDRQHARSDSRAHCGRWSGYAKDAESDKLKPCHRLVRLEDGEVASVRQRAPGERRYEAGGARDGEEQGATEAERASVDAKHAVHARNRQPEARAAEAVARGLAVAG